MFKVLYIVILLFVVAMADTCVQSMTALRTATMLVIVINCPRLFVVVTNL